MVIYGTTHRIGNDVTTERIIAPEYHDTGDPALLAGHCLEAVDPALAEQVAEGDVLLAGVGFGAGDDVDVAVLALQALGVAAVICISAATSFVAAAEQYGLPVLAAPAAVAALSPGTVVRIDLERGTITDRTSGARFACMPASPNLLAAVRRAALLGLMRRVVEEEGFDG